MTDRVFQGFADLTGQRLGNLSVIGLAGRNPVRWHVRCHLCRTSWQETHTVLTTNAVCRNVACRKATEFHAKQAIRSSYGYGTGTDPHMNFDPSDLKVKGHVPW
jgi:hypothetical protein